MKQLDPYFKTMLAGLKLMRDGVDALSRQLERVIDSVEGFASPPDEKAKEKVESEPARKSPAKSKKPAPEKKKPATATETVLTIIDRSKKGIDTATIMKKTGYNQKKVANIVYKLKKQGKIKSTDKGIYLKI